MEQPEEDNTPRRSLRRTALASIDNQTTRGLTPEEVSTPSLSADEFIIEQRGRRRQPITWSPVEYNRTDLLGAPRDKTPEKTPARTEISSRLRRRLVMTNTDEPPQLGNTIAKKLRAIGEVKEEKKKKERK